MNYRQTCRFLLCATVAMCGCEAEPSEGAGGGIQVSLEPSAAVAVGTTATDALDRVRGLAAADGRLAVANGGSNEVLVFDTTGALVQRIGREGEGPGEFRGLINVQFFRRDSLLTYDSRLQRFSIFGQDGSYVRSFRLTPSTAEESRALSILGVVQDSLIVVQSIRLSGASSVPSGASRSLIDILRVSADGEILDTVTVIPGWEAYGMSEGGIAIGNMPVPFGHSGFAAVADNRVVIAVSDSNVVRVYRPDGTLAHSIPAAAPEGPPVSADEIAEFKRSALDNAPPEMHAQLKTLYDRAPIPDKKPPFTGVYAGRDGTLWLRTYGTDEMQHFLLFDVDGTPIGSADMPSAFRISEVDLGGAVGVWTDSLGVETVRRHKLKQVGRDS